VSVDGMLADVRAARDAVAHAGKVAIVGYCWGGWVTWTAAANLDFACAVVYYGNIIEDGDLAMRCPVMGHFGERDAMIPADKIREIAARHPEHQIFTYDADHGFNCDDRVTYDEAATKLARERTLAFLAKHVG
jgi:carboxymethylenebutenolidase